MFKRFFFKSSLSHQELVCNWSPAEMLNTCSGKNSLQLRYNIELRFVKTLEVFIDLFMYILFI